MANADCWHTDKHQGSWVLHSTGRVVCAICHPEPEQRPVTTGTAGFRVDMEVRRGE